MIYGLNVSKGKSFAVSLLFLIAVMLSCKGPDKKPAYDPDAIELNRKAVQLMQRMEYDSALMLFNKAIELDENYYLPYSNMTGIFLSRKQFDEALKASVKVVEINPDFAEGWSFAGMLYDRLGDSLTANNYYQKSIEIYDERIKDPGKKEQIAANRFNRAFSLILLGQEKEGKDEMRKLKSEYPYDLLVDEYLKLDKEDYIRQMIDDE